MRRLTRDARSRTETHPNVKDSKGNSIDITWSLAEAKDMVTQVAGAILMLNQRKDAEVAEMRWRGKRKKDGDLVFRITRRRLTLAAAHKMSKEMAR